MYPGLAGLGEMAVSDLSLTLVVIGSDDLRLLKALLLLQVSCSRKTKMVPGDHGDCAIVFPGRGTPETTVCWWGLSTPTAMVCTSLDQHSLTHGSPQVPTPFASQWKPSQAGIHSSSLWDHHFLATISKIISHAQTPD